MQFLMLHGHATEDWAGVWARDCPPRFLKGYAALPFLSERTSLSLSLREREREIRTVTVSEAILPLPPGGPSRVAGAAVRDEVGVPEAMGMTVGARHRWCNSRGVAACKRWITMISSCPPG